MRILIILCSFLVASFIDLTNSQQSCYTPDNKNGVCIPLRDCEPLFQIILDFRTSTAAQRDFVKRSQCGGNQRNPLVCCSQNAPVVNVPVVNTPAVNVPETDSRFAEVLPNPGECGTESHDLIVGGTVTSITDFPWMALINYSRTKWGRKTEDFLCGGSLINKNYVITAAHCVAGSIRSQGWTPISVRLGEHDLRTSPDCEEELDDQTTVQRDCADKEVDVAIAEIKQHEDYLPNSNEQYNDIALIRLARPVRSTNFVKPVCLPIAPHLRIINYDNQPLEVTGFGRTENGTSSDVKLRVNLPGFNFNQCDNIYRQNVRVSLAPTQICAGGEKGKDSCGGDSGGPLMSVDRTDRTLPYTFLTGIVSRGPKSCGSQGFPGIYTRVDQYLDWIMNNIRP